MLSRRAVIAFFLLFSLVSFAQDSDRLRVTSVSVIDKSAGGSPFAITGTLWHARRLYEGELLTSQDSEIIARNISGKAIVTLVIVMNAGSKKNTYQYEYFFSQRVLAVGETLELASKQGWMSWAQFPAPNPPQSESPEEKAEIESRFVQFADGSIFGDKKVAREFLQTRQQAWQLLTELRQVYLKAGPEKFEEALNSEVQSQMIDLFFSSVRDVQQKSGSTAAFDRLNLMLAVAEKRKQEMGSAALQLEE